MFLIACRFGLEMEKITNKDMCRIGLHESHQDQTPGDKPGTCRTF